MVTYTTLLIVSFVVFTVAFAAGLVMTIVIARPPGGKGI